MGDGTTYTCTECDWSTDDRASTKERAVQLAIEHYVESGHSVEREEPDDRLEDAIWSSRW